MEIVDKKISRKDKNKNQITNIIYYQNYNKIFDKI